MKVGSLFSGIGGLELGLERAGMEVAWQVEIDPFCRKVLAKHWPDVPRYEDVQDVGAHNLAPVDLICGGFPCQPVSLAGKGLAQDDERWLWPDFGRIIDELRPRFALLENVPGLLARGMGDVLRGLAEIGYDAEWQCIPAAAFGARHLRHRIFIVAHTTGSRQPGSRVFVHPCHSAENGKGKAVDALDGCFGGEWPPEPNVGRVADGVPNRVDRLRALGNAVVPQVAEWIGHRIMAAANE